LSVHTGLSDPTRADANVTCQDRAAIAQRSSVKTGQTETDAQVPEAGTEVEEDLEPGLVHLRAEHEDLGRAR
jgi:hypothetical protein